MSSAIPIARDVPEGLKERVPMEGIKVSHQDRSSMTTQKSKMSGKSSDTTRFTKSTCQDLDSFNMASTTTSTCKPRAVPVEALKTLDKNRHSSRTRKSVSTYNVKALAGIAIHTPRKFDKDENGKNKAGSLKTAIRVPAGILPHIPKDNPVNFRSYNNKSNNELKITGKILWSSMPSTSCHAASKCSRQGIDASIEPSASLSPQPQNNSVDLIRLNAFSLHRFRANPFHRIKLVVKQKPVEDSGPVYLPSPPESVALDDTSTVSTLPDTSSKQSVVTAPKEHHEGKSSHTVPRGQKSSQVGDMNGSSSIGTKRAPPADSARVEPLSKKRKMQANKTSSRFVCYAPQVRAKSSHSIDKERLLFTLLAIAPTPPIHHSLKS